MTILKILLTKHYVVIQFLISIYLVILFLESFRCKNNSYYLTCPNKLVRYSFSHILVIYLLLTEFRKHSLYFAFVKFENSNYYEYLVNQDECQGNIKIKSLEILGRVLITIKRLYTYFYILKINLKFQIESEIEILSKNYLVKLLRDLYLFYKFM